MFQRKVYIFIHGTSVMRKLNTEIAARINRSLVLTHIHNNPNISRAQLARLTGMDRSTITHILNYLIEEKIVAERDKGKASARGGRRPIQLSVCYESRGLIGIEVGLNRCSAVLANLNGEQRCRVSCAMERGAPLLPILIKVLDLLKRQAPARFAQAAGIAVSCPGIVDHEKGVLLHSDYHEWHHVEISAQLSRHFGLPVYVENDANAAARGELCELTIEDASSLLYLFIRESPPRSESMLGVGGALIINNQVWHGAHHHAGEMAHQINRFFHQNGMENAWELRRSAALFDNSLSAVLNAADAGDPRARELIGGVVDHIANTLCQLEAFLDPRLVMVAVDEPHEHFIRMIQDAFWKFYSPNVERNVQFVMPRLGAGAVMRGLMDLLQEMVFVRDTTRISLVFA
ncbi:MAG: hypothetical protein Kow0059_02250 [Candidatus Sumerlaeia bacterium]